MRKTTAELMEDYTRIWRAISASRTVLEKEVVFGEWLNTAEKYVAENILREATLDAVEAMGENRTEVLIHIAWSARGRGALGKATHSVAKVTASINDLDSTIHRMTTATPMRITKF